MGHTNIVKFMIDRGAGPKITTPGWLTLLGLAADAGHASLVKYLLQAGARQGIENALGHRPVYLAAFEGHKDVVEVLLSDTKEHGDKPDKVELMTEALFAAARARHVSVIQLLLTHEGASKRRSFWTESSYCGCDQRR
jgi:ankyrin repeat protein